MKLLFEGVQSGIRGMGCSEFGCFLYDVGEKKDEDLEVQSKSLGRLSIAQIQKPCIITTYNNLNSW